MNNNLLKQFEDKYNIKYFLNNTILISYPKSGRTWLRMIFAATLKEQNVNTDKSEMMPAFHYSVDEVLARIGSDVKVIFLHREPGDVVVSYHAEKSTSLRSGSVYPHGLSNFIRDPQFGIENTVKFNQEWLSRGSKEFKDFTVISYEDLQNLKESEVARIYKKIKFNFKIEDVKKAFEYSSFNNMKKIEQTNKGNLLKSYKGNFGKSAGRVRSGKMNDYINVVSEKDLMYINEVKERYGYEIL